MPKAATLDRATKLLDPRPLDFSDPHPQGAKEASSPAFYAPPPERREGERKVPGPMEKIRRRLLGGTRETKLFLSGHVGSGKSTELSLLATHKEMLERFSVVLLRFEEHEWATLDAAQVLFRVAAALYQAHKTKLPKEGAWKKKLNALNESVFTPMGVGTPEGSVGLEFDLIIVKLKQELKLSAKARNEFREYGETQRSVLQDFVAALVDDIEEALSKLPDEPGELVMIVDDLDKVRGLEQQTDVFDTNLNALLSLPLRIVYTLPTGVRFTARHADVIHNVEHLYPVRVLHKAPDTYDPERAWFDERLGFFQALIAQRVEPGLFEDEAIRLAAIYSGGVLREFFRLLREGVLLALFNDMTVVDHISLQYAIKDARLNESIGLYAPDHEALALVHRTNELPSAEDRRYLDSSRVIECHNGNLWFEVNPLLWPVLAEHEKRRNAQPQPAQP